MAEAQHSSAKALCVALAGEDPNQIARWASWPKSAALPLEELTAADIAALSRGAAPMSILLAHDPRRLTEGAGLGIPLVLSGHTHGGQVVLPVIGAVAAQKFPVVAGLARRERTTIFVSRGIGTVYVPVRINCPPEVAILTLQRHA